MMGGIDGSMMFDHGLMMGNNGEFSPLRSQMAMGEVINRGLMMVNN